VAITVGSRGEGPVTIDKIIIIIIIIIMVKQSHYRPE
jgi:hypothetical protein